MQFLTARFGRMKRLAPVVAALFCFALAPSASADIPYPGYIASLPQASLVLEDVKGTAPLDTAARQHAALTILREAIGIFEGQTFQNVPGLTPEGRARWQEYMQAEGNVEAGILKTFDATCKGEQCDRTRYYNSTWRYESDATFRKDIFGRFLPSILQRAILAAKDKSAQPQTVTTNGYVAPESSGELKSWLILIGIVAAVALVVQRRRAKKQRAQKDRIAQCQPERLAGDLLARFGTTEAERAAAIDAFFDESASQCAAHFIHITNPKNPGMKDRLRAHAGITRALAMMSSQERELLRVLYQLANMGFVQPFDFCFANLAIVYADGKGAVGKSQCHQGEAYLPDKLWASIHDAIQEYFTKNGYGGVQATLNLIYGWLMDAGKAHPDRPLVQRLMNKITGQSSPVRQAEAAPLDETLTEGMRLLLGQDEETGKPVYYEGEGSLITIAPPGSGKTRCHVLPNLLLWKGPAVVLDVKGEIYGATAKWREQNVGSVFKFSPLDPHGSHGYNPLALVRDDAEYVWDDARFLADMMIVPASSKDPFWELRARDVLQAAIADVCFGAQSVTPTLSRVLDVIYNVNWNDFIARLKACVDVEAMYRAGCSLETMDAKLKDSVLQTAQTSLSAWGGPQVARAIARTDWTPLDLISGTNPTIYICVGSGKVSSYLSVLRVLIAQHIRAITSAPLPERNTQDILFMLDELPTLRHMQPVEEALDVGRGHGVHLWMFAQNLGQMEKAYENAAGMISNCARRMYMNPSSHDGTAQKISNEMGTRESVLDGQRVPIASPEALAGPEYQDAVIVMGGSERPRRLRKYSVDMDESLKKKL